LFTFIILGCPKKSSDNNITLVEKDRRDAIDELMLKEDDEFEGIPESNEQENEEAEPKVDDED
jgi:hypothetical protein